MEYPKRKLSWAYPFMVVDLSLMTPNKMASTVEHMLASPRDHIPDKKVSGDTRRLCKPRVDVDLSLMTPSKMASTVEHMLASPRDHIPDKKVSGDTRRLCKP